MVPMAPSSTKMRSAASSRSLVSFADIVADLELAIGLGVLPLMRVERQSLPAWAQPEQMANRVDQIGAVHGVEMKIGDAAIDQIKHLLGGNRGRDQLAG